MARTLQQAVDLILRGIGEQPGTVNSAIQSQGKRTAKAVDAVNDALAEIWGRAKWDFRLAWHPLILATGNSWYNAPDDFAEFAFDLPTFAATSPIEYQDWRKFIEENPWCRAVDVSAGGFGITWATQSSSDARNTGTPRIYSIFADRLFLYPSPDAAFMATNPSIALGYYRSSPEVAEPDDDIALPKGLLNAHKFLSLCFLKQALEYADFQADEGRAERYIAKELSRMGKAVRRTPRVETPYKSWAGDL